jgi:hypothetical protein
MAQTKEMKVEVKALTKYGFQDATGAYVGWSKNFKETDKSQVVPGRFFNVEMYIADSGKQYVNKVLSQLDTVKTEDTVVTPKAIVARPIKPSVSETMTKAEWADKDTRISRQGVIQAAVQAVSHMGTSVDTDSLFVEAEALAQLMLQFVNQK